jgi:predicted  nucleic acid-binding Zn-ribbon protein
MTGAEMQRAMDFIVEQEAKSSAKIDALAEAQKEAEERWKRGDERWARTEEGIRALLAIAELHVKEIQANTQQILSLAETTRATDDRLNVLINVIERHISEGRNGK